jgi:hypothetical protein
MDNNFATDGVASTDSTLAAPLAAPPPPPPAAGAAQPSAKDADDARERDAAVKKVEDKSRGANLVQEQYKNDSSMLKQSPGTATQSGPMRNSENQYNRQLENLERAKPAKRSVRKEEEASGGRKVVSGRTFERKENVWYDTAYQGRPTINVRRGTAEFNRLDGGLRSISNSLSGTIVVVWGAKAYRIQ